jgi:hypothetical protein
MACSEKSKELKMPQGLQISKMHKEMINKPLILVILHVFVAFDWNISYPRGFKE